MLKGSKCMLASALCLAAITAGPVSAEIIEFDFQGNAGFGLLPGNEVGANTSLGSASTASGGEIGDGISYNTDTQQLLIPFSFEGLSGGLFTAAASGIHLHQGTPGTDPFNETGGIVFNLNNFADDVVLNANTPISDGATFGTVAALIDVSDALEDALFAGEIYLNIHSVDFTGGELRANLVVVPEPTTAGLLAVGALAALRRRRSA